jgi:uncharacterized protein
VIVVDTSGVLALKDEAHPEHAAVAEVIGATNEALLLSTLVLAECDYMLGSRLGAGAAREFLAEVVHGALELVELDTGDIAAACGIIDRYRDLNIGIADASIAVIAARYQTTCLLTLDPRHFLAVAPLWGAPAFTLLPADR